MPKHYYAMYADTPDEIAIFTSEQHRNDWISYNDSYSKVVPGYYDGKRIAIPRIFAEYIVGRETLQSGNDTDDFYFEEDYHNEEITWVISNNSRKLAKEEMLAVITPPLEYKTATA